MVVFTLTCLFSGVYYVFLIVGRRGFNGGFCLCSAGIVTHDIFDIYITALECFASHYPSREDLWEADDDMVPPLTMEIQFHSRAHC